VQAITNVDLAIIDDNDFLMAQDRDALKMSLDDRVRFLSEVPLLKRLDKYKLLRYASALVQEEVNKGVVLVTPGMVSRDLFFVLNGKVDVIKNMKKRYAVTTLIRHDYFGESGLINKVSRSPLPLSKDKHILILLTIRIRRRRRKRCWKTCT
jgi:signal-transduction protein with cAMP-binding, CBS, and nucleotidyltransferase domain